MVEKRFCDVCGAEIPNSATVPHNKATKMASGRFWYSAVVMEERDDFCKECGARVRDYIRQLKKEAKT
jgi:rRNA maturation endonuclease Nob1